MRGLEGAPGSEWAEADMPPHAGAGEIDLQAPPEDGVRKWLVAAATEAEVAALPRDHPALLAVLITGAGKTAAAVAVSAALARLDDPTSIGVINVGTAGGLDDTGARLRWPSTAWAWDLDAASLNALGIPARGQLALSGGDGAVIATGDRFVAGGSLRTALQARAALVDMECYAVAAACHAFGTPVRAVKWVSDAADESASDDWSVAVPRGAAVLAEATVDFLDRFRPDPA
ncbi:nucleosidase [Parafrankia sp. EUN1f]|uniref:nucleosidase n=1 Tax=Parafrankia sp. EUN1f TaxID=102897 RepID=UPI0001C44306|nr:nucleosidase [Parafrankia sp. EUN1f]EFC84574.1 purine or other phosphorylase family 1 [Parafrankia sp. EUN1f]